MDILILFFIRLCSRAFFDSLKGAMYSLHSTFQTVEEPEYALSKHRVLLRFDMLAYYLLLYNVNNAAKV